MMKNNKIAIVFILIIAFLLVMVSCTKASGLPNLVGSNNAIGNNQAGNNEAGNNQAGNNQQGNNQQGNNQATGNNQTGNNTTNNTKNNVVNGEKLPQTGVEENGALLIFVAVCIASAIYAYIKIRKYNNIH